MKIISFFFFFLFASINSQNLGESKKLETSINVDFFKYPYKYLDKNFKILIPSVIFEQTITKHNIYRDRIVTHKDSLGVVLTAEFNGEWDKVRIAQNMLSYTFLRLGYHIWLSENDTESLSKKYGFIEPYRFKEFLMNDKNHDAYLKRLFIHLREKVFELTKDEKVKTMNAYQLMNVALRNSPQRIEDFQILAFERKHGYKPDKNTKLGEGCGKENCCQTQKAK